ncbi:hypothetical protein FGO68_gene3579 [Halteria grandinella]|uniref:Uncharacterized protein n=1 Tax=Halteria grandinella TaxID=5974 RepID=A0A8J8T5D3_HALGN|nr:hypothetical protein FGO68_gene3579 [Halteria grandinella]
MGHQRARATTQGHIEGLLSSRLATSQHHVPEQGSDSWQFGICQQCLGLLRAQLIKNQQLAVFEPVGRRRSQLRGLPLTGCSWAISYQ